jgi:SpoVK/Ycf46/Vps4 family AAA+-type ATPase
VLPIRVLVTSTSRDIKAEVILSAVAAEPGMRLDQKRVLSVAETEPLLVGIPASEVSAVIWVGGSFDPNGPADRWLRLRPKLVLLVVNVVGDIVQLGLRNPNLASVVSAVRALAQSVGTDPDQRIARIDLVTPDPLRPMTHDPCVEPDPKPAISEDPGPAVQTPGSTNSETAGAIATQPPAGQMPLLEASIRWVRSVLRGAVANFPVNGGDTPGYSVTRDTLLQSLDQPAAISITEVDEADLDRAIAAAGQSHEPLAVANRELSLGPAGFRALLLTLAPEIDFRFQRCFGYLLDNMGYRTGSAALCRAMLGWAADRADQTDPLHALAKWHILEPSLASQPASEPLRTDRHFAAWLLGDTGALAADPRVRRVLRSRPWPGAHLTACLSDLASISAHCSWALLCGEDPAGWRAVAEKAAADGEATLRVELSALAPVDKVDAEDCGVIVARLAKVTHAIVIADAPPESVAAIDQAVVAGFLAAITVRKCKAALICPDEALAVRLLGNGTYELFPGPALTRAQHTAAVQIAARDSGVFLSPDAAQTAGDRYPLGLDEWEQAMRLAKHRALNGRSQEPILDQFITACKDLANESVGHLVERIEPAFDLKDVILPADRKQQLQEIVNHVRLAPKVFDDWKFREQLPYGQGVAALLSGPSGVGKTMGALAVARALGIQVLRIDLSRVISKYLGDTEKALDRVFTDANRSGSALLIDEADALLGKRSEVKDAHDRWANIEVSYLLQRIESCSLTLLTTNLRQNLDAAFLRRLRFVVDFPRPDIESRELIWRRCLPAESHTLTDGDFRQLARRIDLTGGNIRQITLRAAFAAAAVGEYIGMAHIAQGSRAEYAKLGMPPAELDIPNSRGAAA